MSVCAFSLQRRFRRHEPVNHKVTPCAASIATAENHQARAQAQSCVRLRGQFAEERDQHTYRVHTVSFHFCRHCRSAVPRQVFLL